MSLHFPPTHTSTQLWDPNRRAKVADALTSELWARLPTPRDPDLATALKHLLLAHYRGAQGGVGAAASSELLAALLSEADALRGPDRGALAVRAPAACPGAAGWDETLGGRRGQTAALIEVMGLSASEAGNALKAAGGSLFSAVRAELGHVPLRGAAVDPLVLQYAVYAGLVRHPGAGEAGGSGAPPFLRKAPQLVWKGRDFEAPSLAAAPSSPSGGLPPLPLPPPEVAARLETLRDLFRARNYGDALQLLQRAPAPAPPALRALVLFELGSLRAQQLAQGGRAPETMGLARGVLGPLARDTSALFPALKRLMLRLVDLLAAAEAADDAAASAGGGALPGAAAPLDGPPHEDSARLLQERTRSGSEAGPRAPSPPSAPEPLVFASIEALEHQAVLLAAGPLDACPALIPLLTGLLHRRGAKGSLHKNIIHCEIRTCSVWMSKCLTPISWSDGLSAPLRRHWVQYRGNDPLEDHTGLRKLRTRVLAPGLGLGPGALSPALFPAGAAVGPSSDSGDEDAMLEGRAAPGRVLLRLQYGDMGSEEEEDDDDDDDEDEDGDGEGLAPPPFRGVQAHEGGVYVEEVGEEVRQGLLGGWKSGPLLDASL